MYVTVGSSDDAKGLGRVLIEEKLVAAINVFPMESCYWWEDEIVDAVEAVLIVKTTSDRLPEVERRLRECHPFELPCIVWWRIDGHRPYLSWIADTVQPQG